MSDLSDSGLDIDCEAPQRPKQFAKVQTSIRKSISKPQSPPKTNNDNQQVRQLFEKIRLLETENQELTSQIRQQSANHTDQSATFQLSSEASKKFSELTAKNRQLSAALEVQKSRFQQQNQLITQLQTENTQLYQNLEKVNGKTTKLPTNDIPDPNLDQKLLQKTRENDQLLGKFGEINVKLNHLQSENTKLKQVLAKETGQEIANLDLNNFQGRAEKIINQQTKIKQLQDQIKKLQPTTTPQQPIDEQNPQLEQIASLQQIIEEKNTSLETLNNNLQNAQKKLKLTGARISSLEAENNNARNGIKSLNKKSEIDSKIIQKLRVFLQKPENYELQKPKIAAAEARAKQAENKLQSVLQTLQSGDSQLQIIAAGAQLESQQCKQIISNLRNENSNSNSNLGEFYDFTLKIVESDENVRKIFRAMRNQQTFREGTFEKIIDSLFDVIGQFYANISQDERFAGASQELQGQTQNVQEMLEKTKNDTSRAVLYEQLADQALANRPRKRVKKAGEVVVTEGQMGIVSPKMVTQKQEKTPIEKYRESQVLKQPKPLVSSGVNGNEGQEQHYDEGDYGEIVEDDNVAYDQQNNEESD